MTTTRLAMITATAFLALTPACALLSKSEPIVPRYFTPETIVMKSIDHAAPSGLELRLGRVDADAHVNAKLVRRDSKYEFAYYEERLWTEKPEAYVRRALARAIFDGSGVRQVLSGAATTLEVDVMAFEEVLKPAHVGRVELAYLLYDDRVVLLSGSVAIQRPIADAKDDAAADAIVEALAGAMSGAVDAVAVATTSELRAEASAQTRTP